MTSLWASLWCYQRVLTPLLLRDLVGLIHSLRFGVDSTTVRVVKGRTIVLQQLKM